MDLRILNEIPQNLPSCESTDLADVLGSPTLLDLRRDGKPPLFISTLLHGNETSSWSAVRNLMLDWQHSGAAPSCMLFIGNVYAAKHARRRLEEQPDYNRIWEGGDSEECQLAEHLIEIIRRAAPWLVLDIHNNSGPNPHYSVITDTRSETLSVAALFSRLAIFACHPKGVLTRRTSQICTSVTIEVGIPSDPMSAVRARRYVDRLTHLNALPKSRLTELKIFRNSVQVTIDGSRGEDQRELENLDLELDERNFSSLEAGFRFYRRTGANQLCARSENGEDVTSTYFAVDGHYQVLRKDVILSMYTRDPLIARQDCLCYFLEPALVSW